jgi:cell division protein FtsN
MSSRAGGGGARAAIPQTRLDGGAQAPARAAQQRTSYDRPQTAPPPATPKPVRPAAFEPPRPTPPPAPPAPAPTPANVQHGATRFSSVFGTRRR